MATITRQPFAPLDGARLQALTSTKNRQNAVHSSLAAKRKAPSWTGAGDAENVDPNLFAKRCKGLDGSAPTNGTSRKPTFTLTRASFNMAAPVESLELTKPPLVSSSKPRTLLKPRAPSTKMDSKANGPMRLSPISAPSNRTVIRVSRRAGILTNKRRGTVGPAHTKPAPSNFGSAAPFSLDAALKGTFSSFESRMASSALTPSLTSPLDDSGMDSSWFFDIHEDTVEQEMTNLLQHSTCVLDISSDEESEQKLRREKAEGRDKENIPPPNDVSQTSSARQETTVDDMAVEKARNPLAQLNAADFYADGCDEASVVLISSDESEDAAESENLAATFPEAKITLQHESALEQLEMDHQASEAADRLEEKSVEDIMTGRDNPAFDAALLEPIEGTNESFLLWESGSQKGDEL